MKATFPLSLKISLWLLLNLALLAVIGIGVLVAAGGIGWDAIVRGPGGRRLQDLGSSIVTEYIAASPLGDARRLVLARLGEQYGATFYLCHPTLPGATNPREVLPEAVAQRAEEGPPLGQGAPGGRGRGGQRAGPPPQGEFGPPPLGDDGPPPPRVGPPPPENRREQDQARGRFLVHDLRSGAFWLGVRVPIDRPAPVTVVTRVNSWWGLMRLLDLQPWLIAGAAIVLFSVLFWLPFVRGMTHALGVLSSATGQIAEGRFDTRVPEKRRDEIGALGSSVNRMAARLDTLVNGQKRFLADIAHELGSPLGRLQVATEILETRADPALREHVADVREEVQQMSALVNELLAFTKAGLRPRDAELTAVALAPLVQRVLAREDTVKRAAANVPDHLTVLADASLLDRALGNLVRNAARYAPGSAIAIAARAEGEQVILLVSDEGPGVPPEALARLGEPFYRPEAARTREGGGAGLGLAIVKSGIEACRGTVAFRNRTPQGFEAEIRLKRTHVVES